MRESVIISAVRTPTGKFLGALKDFTAPQLGALVVAEAIRRAGIDPAIVDECIMGNVVSAGSGQNPARQAALNGGLPDHVAALTINKVCGSGLKAVMLADQAILRDARLRSASAHRAQAAAHMVLSKSANDLANAKLAAAGRAVQASTGTPLPTITGPSALSAGELAGWFATKGYAANTTVPMPELASLYIAVGTTETLRGDIAFAQSIIETGYFTFPGGGQLLGTDNNFAGIGACDTCAHGWRFPDAKTGVAAQLQLLHAYQSTKRIPTPLVGKVGVAGCCATWLSLGRVWASAPDYGYAILTIYKQMLDWAVPQRLAAAGI